MVQCMTCDEETWSPESEDWLRVEGPEGDLWICPRDAFKQYYRHYKWAEKCIEREERRNDRMQETVRSVIRTSVAGLILTNLIWFAGAAWAIWRTTQ